SSRSSTSCGAPTRSCYLTSRGCLLHSENDGARRREPATGSTDAAELGVLDLAAVRLAAQLARRFDEQEHPAHSGVTVREAAAVGIGGQRAVESHATVGDERAAF